MVENEKKYLGCDGRTIRKKTNAGKGKKHMHKYIQKVCKIDDYVITPMQTQQF